MLTIKGAVEALASFQIANLSATNWTADAVPPAEAFASMTMPATDPFAFTWSTYEAEALPSISDTALDKVVTDACVGIPTAAQAEPFHL